jgi:toxin ParE1/3/4
MPNYQLTTLAREDLRAVARYTVSTWGIAQARRYQASLENCFQSIGEKKIIGRIFIQRRPDLLLSRFEHHFIFFQMREKKGPLILAVFHEKMDLMSRIAMRLKD